MDLVAIPIYSCSRVSFMRCMSLACFSHGRLSPNCKSSCLSKIEMMLPRNASTYCRVATYVWVNQGQLAWCAMWKYLNSGSVTNDSVCCMKHPMRGLWFDFSWSLTKNMQVTQRFAIKVVKSSKMVCRPLMKEPIVLGLECSTCWPICSTLNELASIVSMLTCCL